MSTNTYNREHIPESVVNKYDFNPYDTVIALILTQYLKGRDYKAELGRVVDGKNINAPELAELLDAATLWAKGTQVQSDDPLTQGIIDTVADTLMNFSGIRYVQSMDMGFAEYLDDFLHDNVSR